MRTLKLALACTLALAATTCTGKLPDPANAAKCGDQCASMNCPPGSSCVMDGNCNPRCQQEFIPPR